LRRTVAIRTDRREDTKMRYEMRKVASGWSVWDTTTNAPAVVRGCWQTALSLEAADDLTDLLNHLDRRKENVAARADA
jgi:hypothetical protein